MSFTFSLTGNSSVLTADISPPINLDGGEYVLGLLDFETYHTIPNVDVHNNKFYYGPIGTPPIEIPVGAYELDEISDYLRLTLFQKNIGFSLRPLKSTSRTRIRCDKEVRFNDGQITDSIGPLLGFENITYIPPDKIVVSDSIVKIIVTNTICINCNLITGSYQNGKLSHTIYQFYPNVPPGYKIVITPSNIVYLPVSVKTISNITIKIQDQDDRLLNFQQETITVRLHLKKLT